MFGQKRLEQRRRNWNYSKELCTRMVQNGCTVTCYNRSGHHVSGAEYDNKTEYEGIRQKYVPTIEKKGLAAVSSFFFCSFLQCIWKIWCSAHSCWGDLHFLHGCQSCLGKSGSYYTWNRLAARKLKSGFGSKLSACGEKNAVKYADGGLLFWAKGVQDY